MPKLQIIRAGQFHPWLGVFETIRVCRGRPLFLEEHWQALRRACNALGLKRPFDFRKCVDQLPAGDGRWRWIIGPDGVSHSFRREPMRRRSAFTLSISSVRVGSANLDARHKTLSYLAHWQARRENPAGESLLLNEKGHLASGSMSNIFWVRGKNVFTPDEASGCRAGVVRDWVMAQTEVRLAHSRTAVLDVADEIFVTNSMLGIYPVTRWNARALKVGAATRFLQRRYAWLVRADGREINRLARTGAFR